MAVVVDRADLLFAEISSRLRPVRDALVVIGLYYITKKFLTFGTHVFRGLRVFGLSRLYSPDFRQKYGQWGVVTGCSRGMGRVFVEELAKRGMDIILVGRNLSTLKQLGTEIESTHGVDTVTVVADFAAGSSAYDEIRRSLEHRDIGILVNNVGVIPEYPMYLTETSENMIWDLVNVNVGAATMMCRLTLPAMVTRGGGAIINMASSAALHPQPLQAAYTATKAYIDYLSEALSYEVSSNGVTVQTLDPYYVCTGMTAFSDLLNKPSLSIPSPEKYVRHALRTLGTSHRTTGYWIHSLQNYFAGLAPRSAYIYGSLLLNKRFRTEAMAKRAKKD